ncbi:hypothetical protein BD324DRAFT_651100 [Kockovaella imperatae]|uniref:Uncharacterized protein n=1 Tax=Kockovaella imperatae TaxID=4999 RepID=A0A1Y1UEW5_9TREE|nr:hypothetical protein BD324DRAFT_651100 [Kockovaella imperatae]ORX36611.1 hypothetical protein BD324DRAFT_651100 [Kockovaella imperatae]
MTTIARPSTPFPHTASLSHSASGSNHHKMTLPPTYHYTTPIHFAPKALPTPTPPSLLARTSSTGSNSSGHYIHLRRSSSARQSPAGEDLSRTPSLVPASPRRGSASSSLLVLTPPSTSTLLLPEVEEDADADDDVDDVEEMDAEESPELPKSRSAGFALPPPTYNWSDKPIEPDTTFDFDSSFSSSPASRLENWITTSNSVTPSNPFRRPALKRRDTPRPSIEQAPKSLKRPAFRRRSTPPPPPSSRASHLRLSPLKEVAESSLSTGQKLRSVITGSQWVVVDRQ